MSSETTIKVPFNKPVRLKDHTKIFEESLDTNFIAGNGVFGKKCETFLEQMYKAPVRLVTSATHALEMTALLLDIKPDDEVIVPSFTFVSTANAFVLRGAKIKFADNDLYGNLLPSEVERLKTKKTKAVMTVHYAGNSADMDLLTDVCKNLNLPLLEDAAQAIGVKYKNQLLGTFGDLGCLSFHETKNLTSGEGGALIVGNSQYLDRAEILREKGTNRNRFLKGLADKYTWVDVGSSYILSDLNAAYLYPQLSVLDQINQRRKVIWDNYYNGISSNLSRLDARVLEAPKYNNSNHHIFAIVFNQPKQRDKFIFDMRAKGIACPFHYVPLHKSPFGVKFYDGEPEKLKNCETLSSCLVRLPLYYNLTDSQCEYVVNSIQEWIRNQ